MTLESGHSVRLCQRTTPFRHNFVLCEYDRWNMLIALRCRCLKRRAWQRRGRPQMTVSWTRLTCAAPQRGAGWQTLSNLYHSLVSRSARSICITVSFLEVPAQSVSQSRFSKCPLESQDMAVTFICTYIHRRILLLFKINICKARDTIHACNVHGVVSMVPVHSATAPRLACLFFPLQD
jgi:hypothetical protein